MCNASINSPAQYVDDSSYANYGVQTYQPSSANSTSYDVSGYNNQAPPSFDLSSVQLPPPNMSCFQPASVGKGQTRYLVTNEPAVYKNIEQNFNLTKTIVRDNIIHHQHNRNVYYNVNRNYNHLIRVVNNDNNYHHYLINNIIRVNDIHNQRIEQVPGGSKNFNDYKQTQRIEAGGCRQGTCAGNGASIGSTASYGAGYSTGQNQYYGYQNSAPSYNYDSQY